MCKKRNAFLLAVLMATSKASAQYFNVTNTDTDPGESGTLPNAVNSANNYYDSSTIAVLSGLGDISIASGAITFQNSSGITLYGSGDSVSVNDGFIVNAGLFTLGDSSGTIVLNGGSSATAFTVNSGSALQVTSNATIHAASGAGVNFTAGGTLASAGSIVGSVSFANAAGTLTNKRGGSIAGNVAMGNYANNVTLQIGSSITGSLNIGTSSLAMLTLGDDTGGGTQSYSQAVGGSTTFAGALTIATSGTWILDKSLPSTTGVLISSGTLQLGNGASVPTLGGVITDNGTLVFDNSTAYTYASPVSGSGALTKIGGGTLTLTGSNSFTGGTSVSGGTLVVGDGTHAASLVGSSSVAAVTVNNGAALQIQNKAQINGGSAGGVNFTAGGLLTNNGSITGGVNFTGTGTVKNGGTISAAVKITSAGTLTNNAVITGTVSIGGNGLINNTGSISGALGFGGDGSLTNSGFISAGVRFTGGGSLDDSGSISGGVVMSNDLDSVTLESGGSISGGVSMGSSADTLTLLPHSSITGAVTMGNGVNTVTIPMGSTINGALNIGTGSLSTLTLTDDGSGAGSTEYLSTAVTGTTTFAGSLNVSTSGTWVLTQSMSSLQGITILSGTLQLGDGSGSAPAMGSGTITDQATLAFSNAVNQTYANAIVGGGMLVKNAGGTLTLTGASALTGGTVVNGGTLILGDGSTVASYTSDGGSGITVYNAAAVQVRNNVNVQSQTQTDAAAYYDSGGSLVNAGTINGSNGAAGVYMDGDGTLVNSGTISTDGNAPAVAFSNFNGSGAANFTNLKGGLISGDVQLVNSDAINAVTLQIGSSITGNLDMGSNSQSTLTLTDDGTGGTQLLSNAVGQLNFSGALYKSGNGTWIVNQGLSTSSVTINAGTLQLGDGTTSNGSVTGNILDNGALVFANPYDQTYSGTITGSGALIKSGGGQLTFNGVDSLASTLDVNAGTLVLGDGHLFSINGSSGAPAVTVSNGAALSVHSNASINGSSGGGVRYTSAGFLTNGGTITGGVAMTNAVNNITLLFGSSIAGGLNVGTNALSTLTLTDDGSGTIPSESYSTAVAGGTTFSGSLLVNTKGTWTLDQSLPSTAGVTISAGTLQLGNGSAAMPSVGGTITDNSTLVLAVPSNQTVTNALAGNGTLIKNGAGGLTLAGTSTFLGSTIDNVGTLALGDGVHAGTFGGSNGVGVAVNSGGSFPQIAANINIVGGLKSDGVDVTPAGAMTNNGHINGGSGGTTMTAQAGGVGINFAAATTLTNAGQIYGGVGDYAGNNGHGGPGGAAVDFMATSTLLNTGVIFGNSGGDGSYIYTPRSTGSGGAGVSFAAGGTVNNSGTISAGRGGDYAQNAGSGAAGILFAATGSVTNTQTGVINGGRGGCGIGAYSPGNYNSGQAGNGGSAISLVGGGTVSNAGVILGGNGGEGAESTYYGSVATAGVAGEGITFAASGSITNTNTGSITGGSGPSQTSPYVNGYTSKPGASGVDLSAGGTLNNAGSIAGGAGQFAYQGIGGGPGGAGASLGASGEIVNSGFITGGPGGISLNVTNGTTINGSKGGGPGGVGITILAGGTLTNSGSINGGLGGISQWAGGSTGANGAGVVFTSAAGTFTNLSGGSITGGVSMDNYPNAVTLQIGSAIAGGLNIGTSTLSSLTLTDNGSGGTQSFSNAIGGTATFNGALTKNGSGTWMLDQAPSSPISVTINQGELSVSADSALGGSSAPLNINGGTLQVTGTMFNSTPRTMNWGANGGGFDIANSANTFTVTQPLAYGGTLTKLGAGTLVLGGGGDNVGLGVVASAGTLVLGKSSNGSVHAVGGGGLVINAGAAAQLAGSGNDQIFDNAGVQINGGTFDLNSQSETIAGLNGTGNVTNSSSGGTGTLTVNGGSFGGTIGTSGNGITLAMNGTGNTFTIAGSNDNGFLGVTVNAGTVVLGKSSSPGVHAVGNGLTVNSGATAQLGGSGGDQIYDGNSVTLNAGTFDMNGQSETIGALAGNGGGVTNTASATVSTLTVSGGVFGGSIADGAGQLSLVKTGGNTLTLNATSNHYTGSTDITAGTLAITSSIASTAVTLDGSHTFASLKLMSVSALSDQTAVAVDAANSPTIVLDYIGNQTVLSLQINGIFVMPGIYGVTNEPAADPTLFNSDLPYLGTFTVAAPEPSLGTAALLPLAGLLARRRRRVVKSKSGLETAPSR